MDDDDDDEDETDGGAGDKNGDATGAVGKGEEPMDDGIMRVGLLGDEISSSANVSSSSS